MSHILNNLDGVRRKQTGSRDHKVSHSPLSLLYSWLSHSFFFNCIISSSLKKMTRLLLKMAQNIYKFFQISVLQEPLFSFLGSRDFLRYFPKILFFGGQEQTCKDVSFHPEILILLQDELYPNYPGDAR